MTSRLLVDGYNVINAHRELSRMAGEDLELARARLIELLAEYSRSRELAVTVVFDGSSSGGTLPHAEDVIGVEVVFSARGQSADAVLERLVVAAEEPRRVTVATSDRATQKAVFARGALRMSSRELVEAFDVVREERSEMGLRPRAPSTVADRLDSEVIARLRRLMGEL